MSATAFDPRRAALRGGSTGTSPTTKETNMLNRLILILTETLALIGSVAVIVAGVLLMVGFTG